MPPEACVESFLLLLGAKSCSFPSIYERGMVQTLRMLRGQRFFQECREHTCRPFLTRWWHQPSFMEGVCRSSSISRQLNGKRLHKISKKASSVLGVLWTWQWWMMVKLSYLMDNTFHPVQETRSATGHFHPGVRMQGEDAAGPSFLLLTGCTTSSINTVHYKHLNQ